MQDALPTKRETKDWRQGRDKATTNVDAHRRMRWWTGAGPVAHETRGDEGRDSATTNVDAHRRTRWWTGAGPVAHEMRGDEGLDGVYRVRPLPSTSIRPTPAVAVHDVQAHLCQFWLALVVQVQSDDGKRWCAAATLLAGYKPIDFPSRLVDKVPFRLVCASNPACRLTPGTQRPINTRKMALRMCPGTREVCRCGKKMDGMVLSCVDSLHAIGGVGYASNLQGRGEYFAQRRRIVSLTFDFPTKTSPGRTRL